MDDVKWLMAREIPRLRRYATMLTNDLAQADDLVQDCLERAIRKRHQLKKFGSIRAWLMRILYTRWISETKRHRNRLEHVPIEDVENRLAYFPDQESSDTCREVLSAFRTLPDKHRAILGLVIVEGMSYDEAAAVLKLPIGTVRSRLARARETLRNAICEKDPDSNSVGLLKKDQGS